MVDSFVDGDVEYSCVVVALRVIDDRVYYFRCNGEYEYQGMMGRPKRWTCSAVFFRAKIGTGI